jgi:hypothetical protein
VPNTLCCPRCGAPHVYFYDNNALPYCGKVLEKTRNVKISLFLSVRTKSALFIWIILRLCQDRERFEKNPLEFKLHYFFRQFNFDFVPFSKKSRSLMKEAGLKPPVNLSTRETAAFDERGSWC